MIKQIIKSELEKYGIQVNMITLISEQSKLFFELKNKYYLSLKESELTIQNSTESLRIYYDSIMYKSENRNLLIHIKDFNYPKDFQRLAEIIKQIESSNSIYEFLKNYVI
jgi:hypothetical protein